MFDHWLATQASTPEQHGTSTTTDETEAPESLRAHGRPAGLRRRAAAYLLDLSLVGGPVLAVAVRLGRSPRETALRAAVLATVAGTLYHVVLEGATGRTVGKAAAGIAVVGGNGSAPTYRAAAIRTALRLLDWLPAGYLAGLLAIRLTERRQRLGDLVANTVVVDHRSDDRA